MIILAGSDVFAARRDAQCRDIIRMTAEESLLTGFDVPYSDLVAHRIEDMLLIRVQSQSVLRYALKNRRICKIVSMKLGKNTKWYTVLDTVNCI